MSEKVKEIRIYLRPMRLAGYAMMAIGALTLGYALWHGLRDTGQDGTLWILFGLHWVREDDDRQLYKHLTKTFHKIGVNIQKAATINMTRPPQRKEK